MKQRENQEAPSGTERSIRPGMTVPPTVLVTELDNGVLIVQGLPDGPRVYLRMVDAVPLRQELARAFDSPSFTSSDGQGEVW